MKPPCSPSAAVLLLASASLWVGCHNELDVHVEEMVDVVSVEVSGEPGSYTFAVGLASPDTGCDLYADWWEIVDEDGGLVFRRVLSHSHVDEQPFVRSGGPVAIDPDQMVRIRGHLNRDGYGGEVWMGSVELGFESIGLGFGGFEHDLAPLEPQPPACRF